MSPTSRDLKDGLIAEVGVLNRKPVHSCNRSRGLQRVQVHIRNGLSHGQRIGRRSWRVLEFAA